MAKLDKIQAYIKKIKLLHLSNLSEPTAIFISLLESYTSNGLFGFFRNPTIIKKAKNLLSHRETLTDIDGVMRNISDCLDECATDYNKNGEFHALLIAFFYYYGYCINKNIFENVLLKNALISADLYKQREDQTWLNNTLKLTRLGTEDIDDNHISHNKYFLEMLLDGIKSVTIPKHQQKVIIETIIKEIHRISALSYELGDLEVWLDLLIKLPIPASMQIPAIECLMPLKEKTRVILVETLAQIIIPNAMIERVNNYLLSLIESHTKTWGNLHKLSDIQHSESIAKAAVKTLLTINPHFNAPDEAVQLLFHDFGLNSSILIDTLLLSKRGKILNESISNSGSLNKAIIREFINRIKSSSTGKYTIETYCKAALKFKLSEENKEELLSVFNARYSLIKAQEDYSDTDNVFTGNKIANTLEIIGQLSYPGFISNDQFNLTLSLLNSADHFKTALRCLELISIPPSRHDEVCYALLNCFITYAAKDSSSYYVTITEILIKIGNLPATLNDTTKKSLFDLLNNESTNKSIKINILCILSKFNMNHDEKEILGKIFIYNLNFQHFDFCRNELDFYSLPLIHEIGGLYSFFIDDDIAENTRTIAFNKYYEYISQNYISLHFLSDETSIPYNNSKMSKALQFHILHKLILDPNLGSMAYERAFKELSTAIMHTPQNQERNLLESLISDINKHFAIHNRLHHQTGRWLLAIEFLGNAQIKENHMPLVITGLLDILECASTSSAYSENFANEIIAKTLVALSNWINAYQMIALLTKVEGRMTDKELFMSLHDKIMVKYQLDTSERFSPLPNEVLLRINAHKN